MATVLDTYPHLDAATLLTSPPATRPFAVVADTDELVREISYRARTGNEPLFLSLAKLGWTRIFATDRVAEEVERNLTARAAGHEYEAMAAWRSEYRPLIRWVTVPERGIDDFTAQEAGLEARMAEVMRRHMADSPTAELALMCAPCFVLTGNKKHLHVAGFGDAGTREALAAAGHKAELELTGMRAISLTELAGAGAWHGTRRTAKLVAGRPIVGVILLLALVLFVRAVHRNRTEVQAFVRRLGNAGVEAAEAAMEHHRRLVDTLAPSLVRAPEEPNPASRIASRLARSSGPRSAERIAGEVGLGREEALRVLREIGAFCFWPGQGWTLGRHLD